MQTLTGSFNKAGSPILKVTIAGVLPDSGQEFEAILDTGFTGFVSMPLVQAFPLGLMLAGTTSVVLADGKSAFNLTATGVVISGGVSQAGIIILQSSACDILLGMDFLRKFGMGLFIHQADQIVSLYDEKEFSTMMSNLAANRASNTESSGAAEGSPPPNPSETS